MEDLYTMISYMPEIIYILFISLALAGLSGLIVNLVVLYHIKDCDTRSRNNPYSKKHVEFYEEGSE